MTEAPVETPAPEAPDPAQEPPAEPSKTDDTDWVAEARKWEQRAKANKTAAEELKKIQDANKTESQRLVEDRDSHKSRAEQAEGELLRLRVGLRKNLTEAQAKRLIGNTEEELEADADDLIATFGGQGGSEAPVSKTRPTENLRGGGDPDTEPEPDLSKVISEIPRR
jgi:hypothetical protein